MKSVNTIPIKFQQRALLHNGGLCIHLCSLHGIHIITLIHLTSPYYPFTSSLPPQRADPAMKNAASFLNRDRVFGIWRSDPFHWSGRGSNNNMQTGSRSNKCKWSFIISVKHKLFAKLAYVRHINITCSSMKSYIHITSDVDVLKPQDKTFVFVIFPDMAKNGYKE